jgi:hypothetical protein
MLRVKRVRIVDAASQQWPKRAVVLARHDPVKARIRSARVNVRALVRRAIGVDVVAVNRCNVLRVQYAKA